ncbi:alpha-protein kinase 3-like [Lampetra planeri]
MTSRSRNGPGAPGQGTRYTPHTPKKSSSRELNPYLSDVRPENRHTLCTVMSQLAEESSPMFAVTPRSRAVSEDTDVRFTCTVSGHPEPEVLWYRDDEQLDRFCGLPKYEILREGKVHTLKVYRCTEEDAAIYQVSARNTKGIVSCSAVLEVATMNEFKIHQRWFNKLKAKAEARRCEAARAPGKENKGTAAHDGVTPATTTAAGTATSWHRSPESRTRRKRRSPDLRNPSPSSSPASVRAERARSRATSSPKRAAHTPHLGGSSEPGAGPPTGPLAGRASPPKRVAGRAEARQDAADAKLNGFHGGPGSVDREASWKSGSARGRGYGSHGDPDDGGDSGGGGGSVVYVMETLEEIITTRPAHKPDAAHFQRSRATGESAAIVTPVKVVDEAEQHERQREKQPEEERSLDAKVPTVGEYLRELLHGAHDGSEPSDTSQPTELSASEMESEKTSEDDTRSSASTTPTEALGFPASPALSPDDFDTAMSTGGTDDETGGHSGRMPASEPLFSPASRPNAVDRTTANTSPGQGTTDAESDACEDLYDTADEESATSPDYSSEAVDSSSDVTEEFGDSYYTLSDGLPSPDSDRTETPLYFYSPNETPLPSDDTDTASSGGWFTARASSSTGDSSVAPASTDTSTEASSGSGRSSSLLGSLAYLAGSPEAAGIAWNARANRGSSDDGALRVAGTRRQGAVPRLLQNAGLNLPLIPPPPALPSVPRSPRQQPAQSPVEYYVVEGPRRRATPGPHGRVRRDEYFQTSGPSPPPDSPEAAMMLLHRSRWAPGGFVQAPHPGVADAHHEGGRRDVVVEGGTPSPPTVGRAGSQRPPSSQLSTDSTDDTCSYAHITSPLGVSSEDSSSTTETEPDLWHPVEEGPPVEPGPPAERAPPSGPGVPSERAEMRGSEMRPGGAMTDGGIGPRANIGSRRPAGESRVDEQGARGKKNVCHSANVETSDKGLRAEGNHDGQQVPVHAAVVARAGGQKAVAGTDPAAERPSAPHSGAGGATRCEAANTAANAVSAASAGKTGAVESDIYLENLGREKQRADRGGENAGIPSGGKSSVRADSSVFVFKLPKVPPVVMERAVEEHGKAERERQVSSAPPTQWPRRAEPKDYLVVAQQEVAADADLAVPPEEPLVDRGKGGEPPVKGDGADEKPRLTESAEVSGDVGEDVSAERPGTDNASELHATPKPMPVARSEALISVETEQHGEEEGEERIPGGCPALPIILVEDTSTGLTSRSPLLARLRGAGSSPETARRALLPSATPQELASGARRKVFIPRGAADAASTPQPPGGEQEGDATEKQPVLLSAVACGSDAAKLLLPTTAGSDTQEPTPVDGERPAPASPAEASQAKVDAGPSEKVAAPPSPKAPSVRAAAPQGPEASDGPRGAPDATTSSPGCLRRLRGWDAVPGPAERATEYPSPGRAEETASTVHDPFKAPQLLRKIRVDAFPDLAGNLKLWCQFFNVLTSSRVSWSRNGTLLTEMELSAGDEGPTSLALPQASRKDHGLYTCTVSNRHGTASAELHLTHEVLRELVNRDEVKDGEEIEMTPLVFAKGARDTSHWGDRFFGRIITEDAPLGGATHRKVFRTRVVYGLAPLFESGSACVLKVHGAIAFSTRRDTAELVAKNQKLTVEVCKSQNTAREYCKLFSAEARTVEGFGEVPEIVPVFMIFRPGSHVPYASLEPELGGRIERFVPEGAGGIPGAEGEAHEKCHTLRHWLYLWTSGNLIVTNAKGVGLTLTDVEVATRVPETAEWGPTPAPLALDAFRDAHSCNRYCALLRLRPLRGPPPGLPGSPQATPRGLAPRSPGVTRKGGVTVAAPRSSPQTARKATLSAGGGAGSPSTPRRASFSSPQSTRKFLSTSPQAPRKRTISGGQSPRQPSSPQAPRRDISLRVQAAAPAGAAPPVEAAPRAPGDETNRANERC